jgi:methyltransferase (TIGR00027 family)
MDEPLVADVSDTARWVAAYRATESERADALFRDPYAALLAGERGIEMKTLAPREVRSGWPLVVRTRIFDELVLSAVASGCDCVVNLGAGLDARPYRLALPSALSWIEADVGSVLDEKEQLLADVVPACKLHRERIDLRDPDRRRSFLRSVAGRYRNGVVLSEGLLVYLDDAEVNDLAHDIASSETLRCWIADFFSPAVLRMMKKGVGRGIERAPFKFAPANGVAFFEKCGWNVDIVRSIFREAGRFGRAPLPVRLASLLPDANPRNLGRHRWAAVVQMTNGRAERRSTT